MSVERDDHDEDDECTCMSRGNGCSTCYETIGWDTEMDCPSCPLHGYRAQGV